MGVAVCRAGGLFVGCCAVPGGRGTHCTLQLMPAGGTSSGAAGRMGQATWLWLVWRVWGTLIVPGEGAAPSAVPLQR